MRCSLELLRSLGFEEKLEQQVEKFNKKRDQAEIDSISLRNSEK